MKLVSAHTSPDSSLDKKHKKSFQNKQKKNVCKQVNNHNTIPKESIIGLNQARYH